MKKIYYNAGYFFLILAIFVFAGFYKPYFSLMPQFKKSTTFIVHFHAVVLSMWVILLIVQLLLIRYKKLRIHRLCTGAAYCVLMGRYGAKGHSRDPRQRYVAGCFPGGIPACYGWNAFPYFLYQRGDT
jgi:uncharacterized membrane protein YfhO